MDNAEQPGAGYKEFNEDISKARRERRKSGMIGCLVIMALLVVAYLAGLTQGRITGFKEGLDEGIRARVKAHSDSQNAHDNASKEETNDVDSADRRHEKQD